MRLFDRVQRVVLVGSLGILGACSHVSVWSIQPMDATIPHAPGSERLPSETKRSPLEAPLVAPRIVIRKLDRRLELWSKETLVRDYPIALGNEPGLDKVREGDHRTPEGEFYVCTRNDRSRFHLFLGLSYPSIEDADRGLASGLISRREFTSIVRAIQRRTRPPWDTGLGGEVGIHGGGTGSDWTWGCIALENDAIEELWRLCPMGTPVQIRK
jgi:hypothetical protein